jgi:NAD(P)-dependent dehydrogenase (short-subunit alcohol dehydrogenase family)
MNLQGKVAIVTGGNTGIGKSIAVALAQEGANVVIDYIAEEHAK